MLIDSSSGNEALGEAYVKYTDGPNKGKGTVYSIVGNSGVNGNITIVPNPIIHAYHICDTCLGSLIVDIDGDRLTGRYLASTGTILDEFTIHKTPLTNIEDEENAANGELIVHPNPVEQSISVNIGTGILLNDAEFGLYNLSGKNVVSVSDITERTFHLNLGHLPKGTYFYRLTIKGELAASGKVLMQ